MRFHIRSIASILISLSMVTCLCGCRNTKEKEAEHSREEADRILDYVSEIHDYVSRTGDTDIYLYLLEGMNSSYLDKYVESAYEYDFEDTYIDGHKEGYEEGFLDGARIVIDYMDEDYREKWWEENIDMIMEKGIEY